MQGTTRQDDDRDGVSPSPTGSRTADDLRAVHTKRRLSTEVLGSDRRSEEERGFILTMTLTPRSSRVIED